MQRVPQLAVPSENSHSHYSIAIPLLLTPLTCLFWCFRRSVPLRVGLLQPHVLRLPPHFPVHIVGLGYQRMRGSDVHSLSDNCHRIVGNRYRSDYSFLVFESPVQSGFFGTNRNCNRFFLIGNAKKTGLDQKKPVLTSSNWDWF
jgi:hypothetical protein